MALENRPFVPWPDATTDTQVYEAQRLLASVGPAEVRRHAAVSRENFHRCDPASGAICFCCACARVLGWEGY